MFRRLDPIFTTTSKRLQSPCRRHRRRVPPLHEKELRLTGNRRISRPCPPFSRPKRRPTRPLPLPLPRATGRLPHRRRRQRRFLPPNFTTTSPWLPPPTKRQSGQRTNRTSLQRQTQNRPQRQVSPPWTQGKIGARTGSDRRQRPSDRIPTPQRRARENASPEPPAGPLKKRCGSLASPPVRSACAEQR